MENQGILIFDRFILGFRLHVLGCLEAQDSKGFCAFLASRASATVASRASNDAFESLRHRYFENFNVRPQAPLLREPQCKTAGTVALGASQY